MTVRYGIVGCGMMAQEHLRNLALIPDCAVTALADPDRGKVQEAEAVCDRAAHLFSDHQSLLDANLCDALLIATPNHTHAEILCDALPHGVPILTEKPLATTVADCRRIMGAAAGRRAPVWVAMEYRQMPPIAVLHQKVHEGLVGTVIMITIREYRYPFLDKVGHWNRFNRHTGGTLVEKCCHFWDLMRLIVASDPIRIYASGAADVNHREERYDGEVPDIIDNALAVVDFANGTRGMLDLCMFGEGCRWQEEISVTGSAARIDVRIPGPVRFDPDGRAHQAVIELSPRGGKTSPLALPDLDDALLRIGDHHGATYFQLHRFDQLVRTGQGRPDVTLEDGLWAVMTGEAAEQSVRTGQSVHLGDL